MNPDRIKNNIIEYIIANEEKLAEIFYRIDCFDLTKVFPEARRIHEHDASTIVYHGRECELNFQSLYKYKGHYVIFQANEGEGDDMECNDYDCVYGGLEQGLQTCLTVVTKQEFNEKDYLAGVDSVLGLVAYFKSMHPKNGKALFMSHMKDDHWNNWE